MRAVTGVRSLLFPDSIAVDRRVAAQRRCGRDGRRERGARVGGQPGPRGGCGPSLLPDRRRPPRSARARIPHGQPRARRSRVRRGGGRGRPGVRRARGRSRGGRGGEGDHGAARSSRARARRGAPRAELHGVLRPGRPGGVERSPPGHDRVGSRRSAVPVGLDRGRVPLARRPHRAALRRVVGGRGGHGRR